MKLDFAHLPQEAAVVVMVRSIGVGTKPSTDRQRLRASLPLSEITRTLCFLNLSDTDPADGRFASQMAQGVNWERGKAGACVRIAVVPAKGGANLETARMFTGFVDAQPHMTARVFATVTEACEWLHLGKAPAAYLDAVGGAASDFALDARSIKVSVSE